MGVWRFLTDDRGYGTVEVLVLTAGAAVIAGLIASALGPRFCAFHERTAQGLADILGSGF